MKRFVGQKEPVCEQELADVMSDLCIFTCFQEI